MLRNKISLILISLVLVIIGCETQNSNPLSSENSITDSNVKESVDPLAKGKPSGETAYACNVDGTFAGYNEINDPDYGVYEYTLWAGKHNDAGTVTITNDDDYVYVTFNTNETADLSEVHVYVWENEVDIPTKRPAPGHADYVVEDINADSYTVMIPLSDVTAPCGDTYFISTHAALTGNNTDNDEDGTGDNAGETAYAGGSDSPGCFDDQKGAWWGYVNYTVACFFDVSGTVYEDFNHDENMSGDESGLEGICVELLDASGAVIASTTTDADGGYLLEHVAGGAGYTVQTCSVPGFDHDSHENNGGYAIVDLGSDQADIDFGFGPLFDLDASAALAADADGSCLGSIELTIDGALVSSLEKVVPGTYVVVAIAYDADGGVLATETVSVDLVEDTSVSLELGGWTCPVAPPVDCNECVDGELVANGSFEGSLDSWTNNYGHSTAGYPIDHGTFWSTDGAWTVDLIGTGPSAPGFVEQTLCTEVGEDYTLTFDVNLTGSGSLVVTIDGISQTVTSTGSKSILFNATSTSATIRFEASAYLNYLSNNVLLDNVSVACGDGESE